MIAGPTAETANAAFDANPHIKSPTARLRNYLVKLDWPKISLVFGLTLLLLVAVILYHTIEQIRWSDVRAAMQAVSWTDIAGAFAATAASYTALVGYDILALRQVCASTVSHRFAALTSFISHSFTFMLGFGVLTGGAVRLRLYQIKGLEPGRIVAVGLLCAISFWMGLAALAGICLIVEPVTLTQADGFSPAINVGIGVCVLLALAGWIVYSAVKPRLISVSGWELRLPGPGPTLVAMAIGAADTAFAALALWLLLPQTPDIAFPGFLVIFVIATVLGVVSHVPGGLGVFEAVIILGLPSLPDAGAIGSLLLFRLIYYAVPFMLASSALAFHEARPHAAKLGGAQRAFAAAARPFLVPVTAVAVFLGGFVLLLSGALPAEHDRLSLLRDVVPLPFVETSHFIASIVGASLLIVGYGLFRRLHSAWRIAMPLMAAGAVFSLIKGFDYEEATVCLAIMGLLWASRAEFYRHGGLLETPLSREWLFAIALAIAFSVWAGFMIYRHVDYSNTLWWDFAYRGDAPRFMRASMGVTVTLLLFMFYRVLHHTPDSAIAVGRPDPTLLRSIVQQSHTTSAQLAYLGDKQFLFSETGQGFVMYNVHGSTWLAMGDPLGSDEKTIVDLIWRFKEAADLHGGTPAFYQVSANYLPLYIDAGFSFAKLGEAALVDLDSFTLEGKDGRKFRQGKTHAERHGLSFEIIPAAKVPEYLKRLKPISDAWLAERKAKEKGFSLGFWSEPYLSRYDIAVVRHHGQELAFANIWKTGGKHEYSVDLMRHLPDMPNGTMDYLFICLMAAAKAEGFRWFDLGMAPLSGLARHRLASLWSRFGSLIYRHGNQFYNFKGLRDFKAKFKPDWQPKYLAYPGGLSMARILMDATALIASGPERAGKQR